MQSIRHSVAGALALTFVVVSSAFAAPQPPSVAFTPDSADFGDVTAGSLSDAGFDLTNSGRSSGRITASLTGSSAFSIIGNTCTGMNLGRGESCQVSVRFTAPATTGDYAATLVAAVKKSAPLASASLLGTSTGAANQLPDAGDDSVLDAYHNDPAFDWGWLDNDTDPDGDALTIVATGGSPEGLVTITGGGTGLTYDPNQAFDSLTPGQTTTDSFTYTVDDGNGGRDTATVTVRILALATNYDALCPPLLLSSSTVSRGDIIQVSGQTANPGWPVLILLNGVEIGSTSSDLENRFFTTMVTIPMDAVSGTVHAFEVGNLPQPEIGCGSETSIVVL